MSDDLKPSKSRDERSRDESVDGERTSTERRGERTEASAHLSQSCERMGPELKAYADGQSNLWQRFVVERQLTRCSACRAEVEEMRRFKATLQEADSIAFTPALRARILAAVPESVPAQDAALTGSARPQFRSPLRHPLALAGGVAGVIVLAVLCYPLLAPSDSTRDTASVATKAAMPSPSMAPTAPVPASSSSASAGEPVRADEIEMSHPSTTKQEAKAKPQIATAAPSGMVAPSKRFASGGSFANPAGAADIAEQKVQPGAQFAHRATPANPILGGTKASGVAKPTTGSIGWNGALPPLQVANPPHTATSHTEISVSVHDVETCAALIEAETRQIGGTVVLSRIDKSADAAPTSELTLKIPSAQLETFRDRIQHSEVILTAPHAQGAANAPVATKNRPENSVDVIVRVTRRE